MNTNQTETLSVDKEHARFIYRLIECDVRDGDYGHNEGTLMCFQDCQDYVDANEYLIRTCVQSDLRDYDFLNAILEQVDVLLAANPIVIHDRDPVQEVSFADQLNAFLNKTN